MATCRDCFHCNACHEMWLIAVSQEDDFFERNDAETCEDFVNTADVEEVKHGEWIEDFKPIDTVGMGSGKSSYLVGYKCSLCGRSEIKKEPYCNCGAKMDGGKAE